MKKIIIGLMIVISIGGMITYNVLNSNVDSESGRKPFRGKGVEVTAEVVEVGEISSSILVSGSVKEINQMNINSEQSLKIEDVFVEIGDEVNKGQQLFSVDMESIEDELAKTVINYEIANLQLQKLQQMSGNNQSARIGVELAKLSLASAQRAYDNKAEEIEKNKGLLEEGIITQNEFDRMNSGLEEAQSAIDSAKLTLQRNQSDISTSTASTDIDIQIQVMNLKVMDMTIANLEKQLKKMKELSEAPMSGVVTSLTIEEGHRAGAMSDLVTITDVENLKIEASVREYDIKKVDEGQKVVITGDAIQSDATVEGIISYVAPVATQSNINNRTTTAVKIEVAVTEGIDLLKPGYKTDCEVMTEHKEEAVIASYNMFKPGKKGDTKVFVINEDGVAEERTIELGITSDFDAEVVEGLEEGDQVIINPSLTIKDGTHVTVLDDKENDDKDMDEKNSDEKNSDEGKVTEEEEGN